MLDAEEEGVKVRVTLANFAFKGDNFPFLPESEEEVNSAKEVVVVNVGPAEVLPNDVPN